MANTPNLDLKRLDEPESTTKFNYDTYVENNFEKVDAAMGAAPSTLTTVAKSIVPAIIEVKAATQALGTDKADKTYVDDELLDKVDKVPGKGLSTNDFDNTYKAKLDTEIPAQLAEIENAIENPNGINLTRNLPVTDDLTDSYIDGKYYSYDYNISTPMLVLATVYTGIVNNIVPGRKYRVKLYALGAYTLNLCNFYQANGTRISQSATAFYGYTVVDEVNRIVEFTAPPNAAIMSYTNFLADKANGFCIAFLEKMEISWLQVAKENLDNEVSEAFLKTVNGLKYGHCVEKPFGFAVGKKLAAFGDSIVAGSTSPSLAVTDNPFCKIFADKFGMTFYNRGIGGTKIASNDTYSIINRVLTFTTASDYLLVAGGTNDWATGSPLGVLGDTTYETFYGGLDVICNDFKTRYPNAKVIFITPINRNIKPVGAITTLDAYRNAIFEVATKYGYSVVDGSQIGFPEEQGSFANLMCQDGTHPSELGHEFYAKSLMGILA